jgi:hypothetical protein
VVSKLGVGGGGYYLRGNKKRKNDEKDDSYNEGHTKASFTNN